MRTLYSFFPGEPNRNYCFKLDARWARAYFGESSTLRPRFVLVGCSADDQQYATFVLVILQRMLCGSVSDMEAVQRSEQKGHSLAAVQAEHPA